MQVHTQLHELPVFRRAVLTIGTFDGVHLGHRVVVEQLVAKTQELQGESVIITFHPHPRHIVAADQPLSLLTSIEERVQLLQPLGVDHLVVIPFTAEFARLSAQDYVHNFLVKNFSPAAIVIGYDHRFGHGREGNFTLLEHLSNQYHFELVEIPARLLNDITVSSTKIREALIAGRLADANTLLGYRYFFTGKVIPGNRLGRTIGYPTANLQLTTPEKLVPGNGVYAVRCRLMSTGQGLDGMMNIGVRPTVDGSRRTIEVNLFDFDREIYGDLLEVTLYERLRAEQKFSGLDALKAQLALDKEAAMAILAGQH
jgi:riboflavin kinase/FMN adenylyltransferase